jgi:hypothetical protein
MADSSGRPPRLLIVNCASPYFFYIPMGSFGLCDALGKQGIEARIFNPALYPEAEVREWLDATLNSLRPTHVGFVCHWQETVHGLVAAVAMVREWSREVVTLCGGFTASYFAETLLEAVEGLDYVVTGDPEEPVAHLLQGRPTEKIANLVWREGGAIRRSDVRWLMEQPLFDSLRFADSSCLVDAQRYFAKANAKLGFPLLLGRGCVFDCEYCGGSRHAFHLHSGRSKPVTRSISAILADLRLLKASTTVLYICYENDPAFVKTLFRAIGEDRELRGHFTLHYGAWHLLDDEFLDLYQRAFNCSALPPIFEFSPEVIADVRRKGIKRGETYRLEAMEDNFRAISAAFAGRVRIEVFFSRYHPALSAAELREEVGAIVRLKHRMLRQGLPVHVCFDHLSTDIASRYWEEHQERPRDFARFLELKAQVDAGELYPFPVDNLCLLIPEHLPLSLLVRHEAMLLILEQLEHHCHELLHILLAWYKDSWLDELQTVLDPLLSPCEPFFAAPPLVALLAGLDQRLRSTNSASEPPPFLADLLRFSQKKIEQIHLPAPVYTDSAEPQADTCFVLDRSRVTIHEQDYLDLCPLLEKLDEHPATPLPYRRTVCLFLHSGIVTMPHAFYRATLQLLEQPRTLQSYRTELCRQQGIDVQQHFALLDRLIAEGMLLAVSSGSIN